MSDDGSITFGSSFVLVRDTDITGVSGTGVVADGVRWPDGSASIRWRGSRPSAVFWERFGDAVAVHGHGGATRIVWERLGVPDSAYPSAWAELTGYVRQACDDGKPIDAGELLGYLGELHRKALGPVRAWMQQVSGASVSRALAGEENEDE